MSENEKKSVSYDWHKAIVTLEDWNSVDSYLVVPLNKSAGPKINKKNNSRLKFVISVCFNTDIDGLWGPIIVYFDPSTKEVLGGGLRY